MKIPAHHHERQISTLDDFDPATQVFIIIPALILWGALALTVLFTLAAGVVHMTSEPRVEHLYCSETTGLCHK